MSTKMTVRELIEFLSEVEDWGRVVVCASGTDSGAVPVQDAILGRYRNGWSVSEDYPGEPAVILEYSH